MQPQLLWPELCSYLLAAPFANSNVEALTPNVSVFGDWVFKEMWLNEIISVGSNKIELVPL